MNQVAYSKKAREDLLSIWSYIAEDSPNAANRLLDTIKENCALLGDNPDLGQIRPELSPTIRYFPVKKYYPLSKNIAWYRCNPHFTRCARFARCFAFWLIILKTVLRPYIYVRVNKKEPGR